MKSFQGFSTGLVRIVGLPEQFFTELLTDIDDLGELKVALHALWQHSQDEGTFRYFCRDDFIGDERLMNGLALEGHKSPRILDQALERLVKRKFFLKADVNLETGIQSIYFLNSSKGRTAIEAIEQGQWLPSGNIKRPIELRPEPSNIFKLYEAHIGPLTPLIAEGLKDAEETYPNNWFEEAFRIAVENNVRNWRYVEAILRRWKEKGRHERKDRRDTEKDRRRYTDWEGT